MMNRILTLLLAASCLTAVGQITYPYNPDGNADGDIAVGDLQDFLVTYGNPFSPSEILVGGESLTTVITQLQNDIDSLSSGLVFGEKVYWDLDTLPWIFIEFPQMEFSSFEVQQDGILYVHSTQPGHPPYGLSILPPDWLPCPDFNSCPGPTIAAIFNGDEFENFQFNDFNIAPVPAITIAVKKGETVCLRRNAGVAPQRFIWTPITTAEANNESTAWECGDVVTHQGHDYGTISIYGRCWLAESLKFLPEVHEWNDSSADEPRFYLNDYDGTSLMEALTESDFMNTGVYYNQAATKTNICPTGWHVPVVQDWFRMLPYNTSSAALDFLGSLFISPNDWPPPTDEIPLSNAYNTYPLNLQPLGRFISDASGAYWEGVGNQWYQNVPLYGMTGISYHNLNFDLLFQSTGYSTPVRCIKGTE